MPDGVTDKPSRTKNLEGSIGRTPMPIRLRRLAAACCAFVFLTAVAAPAYSSNTLTAGTDNVSPTVDVLILRPIAMATLVGGFAIFVVSSPFVLITRPHEIGKPFKALVATPALYVWRDPLGTH